MRWFFTSDEHYGHSNIIKYCQRPFEDVKEMNEALIANHNAVVRDKDTVIHAGDFCFHPRTACEIIPRLKGHHIFLQGSHDFWAKYLPFIFEREIEGNYIVVCHYPMLAWPKSRHGSIQLFGHAHGKSDLISEKQMDIGVDCNNFYPFSLEEILKKLKENGEFLQSLKNDINCY